MVTIPCVAYFHALSIQNYPQTTSLATEPLDERQANERPCQPVHILTYAGKRLKFPAKQTEPLSLAKGARFKVRGWEGRGGQISAVQSLGKRRGDDKSRSSFAPCSSHSPPRILLLLFMGSRRERNIEKGKERHALYCRHPSSPSFPNTAYSFGQEAIIPFPFTAKNTVSIFSPCLKKWKETAPRPFQ